MSGLMTPGHPGKQGQEALPCVLREHGQSGSFPGWGWETARVHGQLFCLLWLPEKRQGQGVVQGGQDVTTFLSSVLWD